MKILLATDGSSYSEWAARTLVTLGPPPDAEVSILHIKEPPHYLMTPVVAPPYNIEWHKVEHEMEAEAEESASRAIGQAEWILQNIGGGTHSSVIVGNPADEIISAARETGADVVVVGSKGLTGSMLFLLGSVSQKVVKYAPCSVLLAKANPQTDTPRAAKILLATDGSENAAAAARLLSFFHLEEDAEIVLLNVVQPFRGVSRSEDARAAMEQVRESRLGQAKQLIRGTRDHLVTGAKITVAVREGDPAEQILQAGSEMNADLIVVGSKGLGGIKLFLLGSVSHRVCKYSDRSVLLVKMQATRHAG